MEQEAAGASLAQGVPNRSLSRRFETDFWGLGAVIMSMVTAVFVVVSLSSLLDARIAVIWAGLALASFAVVMQCLLAAQKGSGLGLGRWRLGPWTLVWVMVAFGLATISWHWPVDGSAIQISVTYVISAVWLIMGATAAWTVGYLFGAPELLRRPVRRVVSAISCHRMPNIRSPWTPWLLFAIAASARTVTILTTGSLGYVGEAGSGVLALSGYKQLFGALALFAPLAIASAGIQVFVENRRAARATLGILFLSEVLIGALAGGKESFLVASLAVLIPMGAARRRIPRLAVVAVILVFLLLVIPFNQSYRATVRSDVSLSVGDAVSSAPDVLDEALRLASTPSTLPDSASFFLTRIRIIDAPALILQRTPDQIPFRSFEEVLAGPVIGLVPRAIWPDKPVLNSGYQFTQTYYGASDGFSSSAITPQGDLYRHGGWLVMLFGMCLLGVLTRLLDSVFSVSENPHAIFFVMLLFPAFVKMEIDMVSLLASLPATLLTAVAAVYLAFAPRPER